MCVCVYVCVYVCMCVCVYVCMCVCVYVFVCLRPPCEQHLVVVSGVAAQLSSGRNLRPCTAPLRTHPILSSAPEIGRVPRRVRVVRAPARAPGGCTSEWNSLCNGTPSVSTAPGLWRTHQSPGECTEIALPVQDPAPGSA